MEIKKPTINNKSKALNGYSGGLPEEIISVINKLIGHEGANSQLYLHMAAWCDPQGYTGAAKFFRKHAEEERGHMLKLYEFLADKNIVPITPELVAPPQQTFIDLIEILDLSVEREFETTSLYEDACQRALKLPCHQSYTLFQWFIKEQIEEESLFQTLVDKATILMKGGLTGLALIELDDMLGDLV